MVSALKENRHLCVSLVILGTNELFDRDRIFGKTWNTDSVVVNSKGSLEMSERTE